MNIVAEIARQELEKQGKTEVNKRVEDLLLSATYKDLFREYLPAACWPDYLVSKSGMKWTGVMHYVSNPYNPDNITIHNLVNKTNVTTVIVAHIYYISLYIYIYIYRLRFLLDSKMEIIPHC